MATAHIAAIAPTACIGHLTHLADADKRIGLTGERHLMIAAFLRELIGQLFGLGHVLGGLVERCLDLFLQGIQLRFQPLQVIFLSPRLSSNTLIFGNILCQFRIALLILGNDTGNTLQCLHAIAHGPQAVVLAHGQMAVVMLIEVMAFHIEGVASIDLLLHLLVVHINRIDNQREAIDLTHLTVFVADGSSGILQGSTHPFHVIGAVSRKLLDLGHRQAWQGSAVLAIFGSGLELLIVLCHILDDDVVLLYLLLSHLQAPLGFPSGLHVGLTLRLQGHDLLLQLGLLKQVVIAGEDGHILGEVHAVLFIHRSLVDDTRAKAVGLQLGDEELLVLKQVELITIEGTLHSVDDDIYIVIGVELGNLIARTSGTAITLLQVGGSPGYVDVMDCHGTLLGIDTRTKGRGGTEEHTDSAFVHGLDDLLALLLVLRLLNEANLLGWDVIVTNELILDLLEDIPLTRLIGREVTEDELCSLLLVVFLVIVCHQTRTVAGLVLWVIAKEFLVNQSHIE